jgi:hypothetical protein
LLGFVEAGHDATDDRPGTTDDPGDFEPDCSGEGIPLTHDQEEDRSSSRHDA